jgi:EAL domain-containing protein (putative c-di-GMP-specific phosphodiesterase class I)
MLSHALGLSVVAEGVETEEELDWLRAHGCDVAQGYRIARPLMAAELPGYTKNIELRAAGLST